MPLEIGVVACRLERPFDIIAVRMMEGIVFSNRVKQVRFYQIAALAP